MKSGWSLSYLDSNFASLGLKTCLNYDLKSKLCKLVGLLLSGLHTVFTWSNATAFITLFDVATIQI